MPAVGSPLRAPAPGGPPARLAPAWGGALGGGHSMKRAGVMYAGPEMAQEGRGPPAVGAAVGGHLNKN